MNKNVAMLRKVGLSVAVAGLVAGSGSAAAVEFTASADVQNTLAVTVVQDMNFGTLFASGANASAINAIDLAPNGDIAAGSPRAVAGVAGDAPSFLTLGGAQAARGSVSSNNTDFVLTVPAFAQADLDNAGTFDPTQGVAVTVNNDPDEPAFYLTDFVVGDPVGATITPVGGTPGDFDVAPDFGVNDVEFGIGATINTDGAGGTRTAYQAATYTGTFQVTASF